MKRMKYFMTWLLVCILTFSVLSGSVFAEENPDAEDLLVLDETEPVPEDGLILSAAEDDDWDHDAVVMDSGTIDGISWEIVSLKRDPESGYERILNVSGTGAIPDFENPADGCHKELQAPWFKNHWWSDVGSEYGSYLRGITIGSGITYLGTYAFSPYSNLANYIAEVTIPDTVTTIAACAFYSQFDLRRVIIPDSVTSIGEHAFDHRTTIVCSSGSEALRFAKENGNPVEITDLELGLTLGSKGVQEITINKGDTIPYKVTCSVEGITPTVSVSQSQDGYKLLTIDKDAQTITAPIGESTVNGGTAYVTASAGGTSVRCTVHVNQRYTVKYYEGLYEKLLNTAYYNEGSTLTLPKGPTKKGYRFGGWMRVKNQYTDANGCVQLELEKVTKLTGGDADLFTSWTKVTVKKVTGVLLKNYKTRKLVVSFNKVSGAKGYQVQYATTSKFKKSNRVTKTITDTKVTLKKLTKNKTYYVRVRAFKTDSTGARVYGSWSDVKKITIKK